MLFRSPTAPAGDTPIFRIRDARKSLHNACKRLGCPLFSQRSIRAYLIRRLWQAKIDIKLIAKWQGHNDGGKLILNTYTEVFGGNDAAYVSAELAKLSTAPAPADKTVTISAADHQKLLAELHKLRAQAASATPTEPNAGTVESEPA